MYFIKKLFPQSFKNIYHLMQAIAANIVYGFPTRKLKVIGVTGTDGKTTTVQMITKILQQAGKKVAMASTINFVVNGKEEKNLNHYTTESPFKIKKFAKKAVRAGCEYLVLETSSHSLDQHRVWGVNYKTAVITNVTREHLDYHKTMESYRQAKLKLFKEAQIVVVNADMEKHEEFLQFGNERKITYGISSKADVRAENIQLGISGSSYEINGFEYRLQLPGSFNIENALAATCVALGEEIAPVAIKEALGKIEGVAGRMETVANSRGLNILVDYAVTPNALEKLYAFLSSIKKNEQKIIAVFGSCGDRDKGKRPIMAEMISKYADFMIITNEEPYHEDPQKIIDEIAAGISNKKENEQFWKIVDRRVAIAKALQIAKAGDIIAITGMGAQESMVVGDQKILWNDRAVIEEQLKKL